MKYMHVFGMGTLEPSDPQKPWSRRVAHAGLWSLALQFAEQLCAFGRVFVIAIFLLPRGTSVSTTWQSSQLQPWMSFQGSVSSRR